MSDSIEIRAVVDDAAVEKLVRDLEARGRKLPLKRLGVIGVRSVTRNFRDQGRPDKWAPLGGVGYNKTGRDSLGRFKSMRGVRRGKILQDTGRLRNSVEAKILGVADLKVYTDLVYAPPHQFGWPKKGIPARPFMLWQEEDFSDIQTVLADHLIAMNSRSAR